ncbi:MAG: hypothetical protein GXO73_08995 [Calditrichaeota bacterium]|nr:hypothetical protein [Calditrichota bacterium]
MKRGTVLALAFGLSLALVGSAFASGVALTGIGARATALGGAYRGLASDWSAMYWNPAGLVQIDGFQVGGSFEFIRPVAKFTAAPWVTPLGDTTRFSAFREGEVENEPRTFFVPAGGFAYSNGKFAFGLAVFAPFGLGATWDLMDTRSFNPAYPEYEYDDDLQMIDVHPTVAVALNDWLSVGAGLSIMFDKIMIRKPTFIPNPYYSSELSLAVKLMHLREKGLLTAPYTHLIVDTKLEGDGVGFGGNFGLMLKPTENLSFGFSARFYKDATIKGNVNGTAYFPSDSSTNKAIQLFVKPQLDKKLASGEITESEYFAVLNAYSGQTAVVYDNVGATATMPLPANIGFGVAYTGIPNTVITFDMDWTKWSAWNEIKIELDNGDQSALKEMWRDCLRVGGGIEHNFGSFILRGSYYTEPEAPPENTLTPTIPDISRRQVFNIGLSVPFGKAILHASFEKMFIGDRDVKEWILDESGADYLNIAGHYKMSDTNAMFGIEYNF